MQNRHHTCIQVQVNTYIPEMQWEHNIIIMHENEGSCLHSDKEKNDLGYYLYSCEHYVCVHVFLNASVLIDHDVCIHACTSPES